MYQNIKAVFAMLKQLNTILTKKQKRDCLIVFVCMFFGSIFELLSVSSILPFLEVILEPEGLQDKWYVPVIMKLGAKTTYEMIIVITIGIILIYVVKNAYLLFVSYIQNRYCTGISKELSTLMLRSYMKRPYSYFTEHNSAEVLRGINSDTAGVYNILSNMCKVVSESATAFIIALYLISMDTFMALGIVLLAVVCLVSVTFGFKSIMYKMGEKQRKAFAETHKLAFQAVNGIKEISILQKREFFVKQYDEAAEEKRKANLVCTFITSCPARIIETICVASMLGIVCIRLGMGIDMKAFVPNLGVFAMAAFRIMPSISSISSCLSGLVFYKGTLDEAYVNITEARKFDEEKEMYAMQRADKIIAEDVIFEKTLAIKNVTWRYQKNRKNILTDVSLTINKGEAVAFIGASGAGKTTLADIILGLFQPIKGNIEMDGVDIYTIPKIWAKTIGYVPQSVFLIDDTVRNNISFGVEKSEIDDERIWKILEKVQLKEFVQELPKQLNTMVGERGIKFSGGQRQRIAIARALYNNPEILVLDEATSALDNETENAVMEAINALQGEKTLIIVAHRLSTIRKCDKIYEVKDEKVNLVPRENVFDE